MVANASWEEERHSAAMAGHGKAIVAKTAMLRRSAAKIASTPIDGPDRPAFVRDRSLDAKPWSLGGSGRDTGIRRFATEQGTPTQSVLPPVAPPGDTCQKEERAWMSKRRSADGSFPFNDGTALSSDGSRRDRLQWSRGRGKTDGRLPTDGWQTSGRRRLGRLRSGARSCGGQPGNTPDQRILSVGRAKPLVRPDTERWVRVAGPASDEFTLSLSAQGTPKVLAVACFPLPLRCRTGSYFSELAIDAVWQRSRTA
jgi:hypothetical protein